MELEDIKNDINTTCSDCFDTFDKVTNSYAQELDTLIDSIQSVIRDSKDVPTEDLSHMALDLSTTIYTVGSHIEKTGIMSDIASLKRQETYNNATLKLQEDNATAKVKLTVPVITASAEESSKYHTTIKVIYDRVYKQLKFKLDAATEILSSLKKVISQRMQDDNIGDR